MKSILRLQRYPAGIPLVADEILEFHAIRLILLIKICGSKDKVRKQKKIEGLTKIAKLDFFIRYPEFFRKVISYLGKNNEIEHHQGGVESRMIRFHYGPWDQRYYQVLPYLEAKGLLKIEKKGNAFTFFLTELGDLVSENFVEDENYKELITNITNVQKLLSKFTGTQLKSLVYNLFEKEVSLKKLGEKI
jgi:hypothetical protein